MFGMRNESLSALYIYIKKHNRIKPTSKKRKGN